MWPGREEIVIMPGCFRCGKQQSVLTSITPTGKTHGEALCDECLKKEEVKEAD